METVNTETVEAGQMGEKENREKKEKIGRSEERIEKRKVRQKLN